MTGFIKKAVLGAALAASTLVTVAPAQAQYYRDYRHHGNGDAAAGAIIGGIVGLGLGAAIASSGNHNRGYYQDGRYYDRGYNNDRRYYNDQSYYNDRGYYNDRAYDRRGYSNNGYYNNGYSYQQRCYVQQQYDPYSGQVYNVRVCR